MSTFFTFKTKPFFLFSLAFALFTVVGTLSHEYGHIAIAKLFQQETTLHYGSMNHGNPARSTRISELYQSHKEAIENKSDFDGREEYMMLIREQWFESLWVSIGGPLQTVLTGVIGLVILYYQRRRINEASFNFWTWLGVFLGLFWLREIFNLTIGFAKHFLLGRDRLFGGDELHISKMLGLWDGTISLGLGLGGLVVSGWIVFKIVPKKLQFTFIFSGLVSSALCFYLWMYIVGPALLP